MNKEIFDLELEGKVEADQTMDCNATIVISKEKLNQKRIKFVHVYNTHHEKIINGTSSCNFPYWIFTIKETVAL